MVLLRLKTVKLFKKMLLTEKYFFQTFSLCTQVQKGIEVFPATEVAGSIFWRLCDEEKLRDYYSF